MRFLGELMIVGGLSSLVSYVIGREHGRHEGIHQTLRAFYHDRKAVEKVAADLTRRLNESA